MTVTIYSTSTCAICHAEMKWLDKESIPYTDVVVDESDDAMKQFLEATNGAFQTPPFTVITNDDGEQKIAGFDKGKLQKALGL